MRIALIRHGRTAWNAEGRVQGSTETSLSEEGRAQMAALAPPSGFAAVRAFVSPQKRARETAALLGLAPVADPRLREQNWGIWEGLTRAEMKARFGDDCFEKAGIGFAFRPPGGESSGELAARVKDFLLDIGRNPADAVAVAHMGVLRAAFAVATGWDMAGPAPGVDLRAAMILSVTDGTISLAGLNVALAQKVQA